ncbi:MAG: SpoIIE family protein phosphatase [Bacteroidota bacterium]
MQPFKPSSLIFPLLFGIVGLAIYFGVRTDVSPKASVDLNLSRSEAELKAKNFLRSIGHSTDGLSIESNFQFNSAVYQFLVENLGMRRTRDVILADTLVAHRWVLYFYDGQTSTSRMAHQYRVWITQSGTITGFNHMIQDTAQGEKLSLDSAQALAEQFLRHVPIRLDEFYLKRTTTNNQAKRTDYTFFWAKKYSLHDAHTEITMRIQGNEVGFFLKDFTPPQSFIQRINDSFSSFAVFSIVSYVILFFLVIFVISIFLKKYHEGEVGIRTAVYVAAFLFGTAALTNILGYESIGFGVMMGDSNRTFVKLLLFVIILFIIYGFLTAMTFAAWSVGESSARQGWGQKLSGIDSLIQGKFFTSNVAYSILWGYGIGFGLFGLTALFYYGVLRVADTSILTISLGGVPEAYSQSVFAIVGATVGAIISEITFRLFIVSWVKEKFRSVALGIIFSSLVWSFTATSLWDVPFGSLESWWQFIIFFVIGVVLCVTYLRYGILASIFASSLVYTLGIFEPIVFSNAPAFDVEKILFGILMLIPFTVAAVGYVRNEEFHFSVDATPSHIKRISERERMAKELEIARNVQMSLLPKENPHVAGFDIAGICIPAFEVGGDYYDFVYLGDNKIGIAIGDVSGKGVPAAIYMTLTKGILQSHAEDNVSPKVVLSKVNRLMYRTIEKNSFVSMFYAIIDLKTKTIRYSRAGHNPVILVGLREDKHEFLTPQGVALGLDEGGVFDSVLEEREYKLRDGDLLVFYTDGFTEARNEKSEEFGEARLLQSVASKKEFPSEKIIGAVVHDAKKFIGDVQQHDDMTMVVVKVG